MFEDLTKEAVQQRVLERLPDDDDTEPHSPLYIITAETAYGWELFYKDQSYALDQAFFLGCDREHLIRHAQPYGFSPFPASYAQVEGEFNIELAIGTRFSKGQVNFTIQEFLRKEDNYCYYSMVCEQAGEIGNVAPGRILPINLIDGLTHAYITKVLVPGEEEEETETFRERFLSSFRSKAFCANLADYFREMAAFPGVGKFKILRCINNEGNQDPEWVTVIFTDSQFKKPSEELVEDLQEYFQPLDEETHLPSHKTSGVGLASIGQLCWVEGVKENKIDFALNLVFESGFNWDNTQEAIKEALQKKLLEYIEKDWGDTVLTERSYRPMQNYITVQRAHMESELLDIEGIQDSLGIKINGVLGNFQLKWNEIPTLGEVTLESFSIGEPEPGDCPYNCPDCQCNHNQDICGRMN